MKNYLLKFHAYLSNAEFRWNDRAAHLFDSCESFLKDVYTATCSPLGAVGGKNNLPGAYDLYLFFKRYHIIFYYIIFIALLIECKYWHLCAALFMAGEALVFFLRPFAVFEGVWVLRAALATIFIRTAEAHEGADAANADVVTILNVHELSVHVLPIEWLVTVTNSFVSLDAMIAHSFGWFLAEYLPYYLQTLIIFLPLFSAVFILLTGYLIGYVLAGYFATFCMLLAAMSASYLWLIYPAVHKKFIHTVGIDGQSLPFRLRESLNDPYSVHMQIRDPIEQEWVNNLYGDPVHSLMSTSQNINLTLDFGTFIDSPSFYASFEFVLDSVSVVMVFVITTISFLVHLYSTVYMGSDPHKVRFFALLSLFTFFMIVLVLAGNLVILYIGWEGVGLSSFLLIAFWFTRVAAVKAATKALLINKIGDMFLVFASGIFVFYTKGTTTIASLSFFMADAAEDTIVGSLTAFDAAAIALVVAALVKSAQIFFHTWLADAMEGPTPVSALLHAATMVTAGVYLVIRFSPIIEFSPSAKSLMFFGGYFTIILASLVAMAQYDIKKIIAYSTCSQLGAMFLACGLSAYDYALFHFFNHAFFKCLLFLLAGGIIHQLKGEQDIRKMGGLVFKMPKTFLLFLVATLSLVGAPGFSGAVSKDKILHLVNYSAGSADDWTVALFLYSNNIMIFLTAAYSFRLLYYVFLGHPNYNAKLLTAGKDADAASNPVYGFIFGFLAVMSVVGGKVFERFFVNTAGQFVSIHEEICIRSPYHAEAAADVDYLAVAYLLTLLALALSASIMFYARFTKRALWAGWRRSRALYTVFCFFNRKCYFDEVYNLYLVRPILALSYVFVHVIEASVFNFFAYKLWSLLNHPRWMRFAEVRFWLWDHMYLSSLTLIVMYAMTFILTVMH